MGTTRVLVLISVAALIAPLYTRTATAQTTSQEASAAGECEWAGSFTTTFPAIPPYVMQNIQGRLRFRYDPILSQSSPADVYELIGETATWSISGSTPNGCTYTGGPMTRPIIGDPATDKGYLYVYPDGRYSAVAGSLTMNNATVVNVVCPDGNDTFRAYFEMFAVPYDSFRVSSDGTTMKGTWTNGQQGILAEQFEWHFTKSDADPELVVEIDGYDDWRPLAGKDEKSPGNGLTIKARLQSADGSPPCGRAERFRFELTKASKEPGIALNYPRKNEATDDYDLQFASPTQGSTQGPFGQFIEMPPGPGGIEAQTVLSAFDWGAWGALKVTAKLPDGREIVGHVEDDESRTEILIPKRQDNSFIADKWKDDQDAAGLADNDDSENEPVGDGDKGDGLTLYEEYRGFRVNGRHRPGDPKKKDLFVYNAAGVNLWPGIRHFAKITGLKVHYFLRAEEFDSLSTSDTFRRINFNHKEGPHEVDQHGIYIRKYNRGLSASVTSSLGPPRHVRYIDFSRKPGDMQSVRRGQRTITRDVGVATVAHELGHAVRMDEHGEADAIRTWTLKLDPVDSTKVYRRPADGRFVVLENGIEVDVREENDVPAPFYEGTFWVGAWGGQHSGVEDCVMRYDNAVFYIPGPGRSSIIRYWTDGEVVGMGLCREPTGTGVNAPSRAPRPRYGNASQLESRGQPRRGNCRAHLCVNDRYHP